MSHRIKNPAEAGSDGPLTDPPAPRFLASAPSTPKGMSSVQGGQPRAVNPEESALPRALLAKPEHPLGLALMGYPLSQK
jgi:hypothetical protein